MNDREAFRASVVASLMRVHGLTLETALGAVNEMADVWDTGLPAEDAAEQLARALRRGERPLAHMGV